MKNLDEVRDSRKGIAAAEAVLACEIIGYPKGDEAISEFTEDIYLNAWNECAKLKDEELRKVVEPLEKNLYSALRYLYWREDDLIGDDLKGDGKLTANYKNMISELEKALEDYEKKASGK